MKKMLLLLISFFLIGSLSSQSVTIVHDGYLGITTTRWGDTVYLYNVIKKGPAGRADIRNWTPLLEIDGIKVSGSEPIEYDHENLLAGMPGETVTVLAQGPTS